MKPHGSQVYALRVALGLTQPEFAELAGVSSFQTISKIERGVINMSATRWELLLLKLEREAPKKAASQGGR